ncbi:MAG: DUF4397 domain-containing protein [Anaerolineae bacterium]|nr:DUF4397 domain-containing protein [Anaerolineae bacterium]
MSRRLILTLTLVIGVLLLGVTPIAAQIQDPALVRLVYAVPDGPPVDIFIDDQLAASQLGYAEYTDYLQLNQGSYLLIAQTADGTLVAQTPLDVLPATAMTAIVVGGDVMVFDDNLTPLQLGNIRLTATNAVPSADPVDVMLADGTPILQGLAYGQNAGEIDIPANSYPLAVVASGSTVDQAIRSPQAYDLYGGMLYRLVVLDGGAGTLMLTTPVNAPADNVQMRLAHAIIGSPAVDVYVNDILLVPHLAPGTMTRHIALPPASYEISVREAGDETTAVLANTSLDLSDGMLAGQGRTLAAVSTGTSLTLQVYEDDFSPLPSEMARINVLNALGGSILTATLEDGTNVGTTASFESSVPSTEVAASVQTLTLDNNGSASTETLILDGGVLYSLLVTGAADSPTVIVGEMPLNFQPGSAAVVVAPAAVETEVVVQPTGAAPQAQPTEETAQVEATTPPLPPTQPPASATQSGPLGLVYNLNPGAGVHLRQYPRADARSLGTVQAGTVLQVVGRAGEPDFQNLITLPPDVDDLDPAQTWLFVIYTGADGSEIQAWTIAQYVQVTEDGASVRLVDLEAVPSNQPGDIIVAGAGGSTATEAPVADFFAQVYNLNPGANLHIRRAPDPSAESLARVPAGTILEPLGILEDVSWLYVRYQPAEGGSLTGWVSAEYIQFVFRGQTFYPAREEDLSELMMRSLLVFADPNTLGDVEAGTGNGESAVPAEFEDQIIATTVLEPNANLHLRRSPDSTSESLALIPNGATMLVLGRTPDATWLEVSYDNQAGWVASLYVELWLNGERADIYDVFESQP